MNWFFKSREKIPKAKVYVKEIESEAYDVAVMKLKDTLGHWHETKEYVPYVEDDRITEYGIRKGCKIKVEPEFFLQYADRIETTTGVLLAHHIVCYEVITTKRFFDRVVYKEVT